MSARMSSFGAGTTPMILDHGGDGRPPGRIGAALGRMSPSC
jgi:hypothetical protein